jgi:dienelactone hydrolase
MRTFLTGALCAGLAAAQPLPGTRALSFDGDAAAAMVEGIHTWLDRETVAAREARAKRTGAPDREKFRTIIGAVDTRVAPSLVYESREPVATGPGYRAYAVRWPVFEDVDAEGLLLEPDGTPKARVVAIPDAGTRPERFAIAQQLAAAGCEVLVPVLIDREDTWSGIPGVRMTNQPHREWIYRMSFEAGRTIIGYEVQKALAGVDWFKGPVAIAGEGEGGLIALYAAALDGRISAALVSGYFGPRDQLWKEPIYRDVWALLRDYGDAEIAAMIAPRKLIVDTTPAVS